jgi:STAS-like domain of unknown function (DUF4325)
MTSSRTDPDAPLLAGRLITRRLARMHRNRLESLLEERSDGVEVDLSQVELMTPSFADEYFGVLAERYGREAFRQRIRIRGAGEDLRHLLAAVIGQRLAGGRRTAS